MSGCIYNIFRLSKGIEGVQTGQEGAEGTFPPKVVSVFGSVRVLKSPPFLERESREVFGMIFLSDSPFLLTRLREGVVTRVTPQ